MSVIVPGTTDTAHTAGMLPCGGYLRAASTVAMHASWSQPVAEEVVFSNDFASRRDRPSLPCATSTRQACRIGRSAALGPGLDRALLRGFEVALRLRDADFVERYDRAWASDEPGAEQEGSRRERDEFSKGLADVWLVIAAFVAMPIERVLVLEVIEGLGSRRLRRLGRTEVGTIMLAAACGAVGFFVFR